MICKRFHDYEIVTLSGHVVLYLEDNLLPIYGELVQEKCLQSKLSKRYKDCLKDTLKEDVIWSNIRQKSVEESDFSSC